ncbi:MAG: hypothetical protein [Microviridae sp.]|nr:MAG: hypothetical protein [Microviridae sp.]
MKPMKPGQQHEARYRSTKDFKPKKSDMEQKNTQPSLTVPDDSYTVQELLTKHQNGLSLGIQRLGNFDLDNDEEHEAIDMNQYQQLEKTEREQIVAENYERRESAKAHKKRQDEAKKAEKAAQTEIKKE